MFLHNTQLLFFDCGFPKWTVLMTLPNAVFFYYLFYDFYKKSYNAPKTGGKMKENVKDKWKGNSLKYVEKNIYLFNFDNKR